MNQKYEFQANFNGDKNFAGSLVFELDGVKFYEDFSLSRPLELILPAQEIESLNFTDTTNEVYQPGFWRLVFFGMLAFARPKNWQQKACRIEIEMMDGNFYYFTISGQSAMDVRAKINQIVTQYF
ncbi:MAG: hypothetical protein Q4A27_01880 [bacterium]|nr:hypothetical protein [bacterium]